MAKSVDFNKATLINGGKPQAQPKITMEQVIRQLIQENRFLAEQLQQLVQQSNATTIGHYALEDLLLKKGIINQEERDEAIKNFVEECEKEDSESNEEEINPEPINDNVETVNFNQN